MPPAMVEIRNSRPRVLSGSLKVLISAVRCLIGTCPKGKSIDCDRILSWWIHSYHPFESNHDLSPISGTVLENSSVLTIVRYSPAPECFVWIPAVCRRWTRIRSKSLETIQIFPIVQSAKKSTRRMTNMLSDLTSNWDCSTSNMSYHHSFFIAFITTLIRSGFSTSSSFASSTLAKYLLTFERDCILFREDFFFGFCERDPSPSSSGSSESSRKNWSVSTRSWPFKYLW